MDSPGPMPTAVEERVRFEALLADVASQCVTVEDRGLDATIEQALASLGGFLDADRGALTQLSPDRGTLIFTHYWSRRAEPAPLPSMDARAVYPHGLARILAGDTHVFSSLDDLPADSPDRRFLESRGTQSGIVVPLVAEGRVLGSFGFTSIRPRRWDPEVVRRMRIIAQVFANALARRQAEADLRRAVDDRLAFETLIGELASRFVSLDCDNVDTGIENAQRQIVETLQIDRSSLFQFDADGTLRLTHYWSRPDLPPLRFDGPVMARFPWITERIQRGETVVLDSIEDLPAGAADRQAMAEANSKATVVVPLVASGRPVGVVSFGSMREPRRWTPTIVARLQLIGQVFASALARRHAEGKLRDTLRENARMRERLMRENIYLKREVRDHEGPSTVLGQSAAILRLLATVDQVAPTASTVLLLGETGTGKELVATAIHERSPRRDRPMVRVNCAAIPSALIESELFGREKGAYTGALARQTGRFEVADGSTIFLDEVGELPPDVQVKLLRVLQERQIERLGSSRSIDIDVRVIAATNRDLEKMVADGTFREDLYYRLNVFPIRVPPLRERPEDIPTLIWAFVDEFARAMGKHVESISPDHLAALQRYRWPGNVRELRNAVERAVIVSTSPRLTIEIPRARPGERGRSLRLDDIEREHILAVLARTHWRVRGRAGAAETLGLKPSTLESRMARLGIRRPDAPPH